MPASKPLKMRIAIADYGHTDEVKKGTIPIEGVDADFVRVEPIIAAFRRMVRDVEFDACEIACTTYFIARAHGAPFKALPIFLLRRFHHGGLVCREDANIKTPKDLEGKKVGVRAYSVTTGVWTRGVLINEYGMDNSKVTWVVDDEEHVTQLQLPPNVIHAPADKSLTGMMESGEIQAGFTARAGIGRQGAPKEGWEDKSDAAPPTNYHDLIDNVAPLEADWYKRTGIYPMHGVLVVKDKLLQENPWLAKSMYTAFNEAKNRYVARLQSGAQMDANDKHANRYRKLMSVVGQDPLPYGIKPNLPTIDGLVKYAIQQKLLPRHMTADELFVNPDA